MTTNCIYGLGILLLVILCPAISHADIFGAEITDVFRDSGREARTAEVCGNASGGRGLVVTITRTCPPDSEPDYFVKPKSFSVLPDEKGQFCVAMPTVARCEFSPSVRPAFQN